MAETLTPIDLHATPISGTDPAFAAALVAARLPGDDLAEPGRSFFAYRTAAGEACGFGGLEVLGPHALIRSMVVPEALRGQGVGTAILAQLLAAASAGGASKAWLLTKTAMPFFGHRGFRAAARYEAPAEILATRQASAMCPITTTLMTRALPA